MSYILDALKKSEEERQKNQPEREFSTVAISPASRVQDVSAGQKWLPVIALLLLLLLILIVLLLWRNTPTEPAVAPVTVPIEKVAVTDIEENSTPVKVPDTVDETPGAVMSSATLQAPVAPVAVSVVPKAGKSGAAPVEALKQIPTLNITGHLYSSVPSKRTVTMNDRVWKEGDTLTQGVSIKEITKDGLSLDVSGWTVFVGRSRGWQAIR